jgi:hypothetical protein
MNVEHGGTYNNHYATRGLSEQNLIREEKPANARLSKTSLLVAKNAIKYIKKICVGKIQKYLITFNFRFSPCVILVSHIYYLTNALNYTKLRS